MKNYIYAVKLNPGTRSKRVVFDGHKKYPWRWNITTLQNLHYRGKN
jgi:hypothetical protein